MAGSSARARTCGALVVTAAALSGCGAISDSMADLTRSDFSQQGATEIARAAEATMTALSSLRITGSLVVGTEPTFLDLRLADDGRCSGSLRVTEGDLDVLQNSQGTWLRGHDLQGKWVKTAKPFALCNLDKWLKGFKVRKDGTDLNGRTMKVGDEVSLDDTKAVQIITVRVEGADDVAYVSSEEPHHVLKMEAEEPTRRANIAFAEFDEEFEVEAPRAKATR